jgi:hypothetical protein
VHLTFTDSNLELVTRPRRTRRRSPSSSSDGEALNSFSSQPITSAIVDSTSAFQVSAPRPDPRQLDSALEALADRADDLTDEDLSPAEVVEAPAIEEPKAEAKYRLGRITSKYLILDIIFSSFFRQRGFSYLHQSSKSLR